jgi:hypothetical protein
MQIDKITVTFYGDEDYGTAQQLRDLSKKRGQSLNKIIINLVKEYISKEYISNENTKG